MWCLSIASHHSVVTLLDELDPCRTGLSGRANEICKTPAHLEMILVAAWWRLRLGH